MRGPFVVLLCTAFAGGCRSPAPDADSSTHRAQVQVSESQAPSTINLREAATAPPSAAAPAAPAGEAPKCPCAAGSICVLQLGHPGPVRRDEPPATPHCVVMPTDCSGLENCACLA